MDSEFRLGLLKNGKDTVSDLEIIPGSAFVGCVQRKGENVVNTQIKERVASFCPQGGANSEFVKVEDASLVQVLNIGLPLDHRYDFEAKPLDRKSILYFTEPTSSFVEPLVRIAKCLGASDVYIPVHESSDLAGHLRLIGAIPFDPAQKSFDGCIDILIRDSNIPTTETMYSSLTDTGFAVTIQKNDENMSKISSDSLYHYNTTHSWTSNLEESKKDLLFLLDLVKNKHLIPKLARTLRLSEVPEAHSYLDAKAPLRGTFVCLPWHKGV
jgi:NADPH:quinone reductase-like Zn-dependent oxidoreductase